MSTAVTTARVDAVNETTEQCDRYPCDHAYRRARHRVEENGIIRHICASLSDPDAGWDTGMVSFEHTDSEGCANGTWQPFLHLTDPEVFMLLVDAEQTQRLAFGLLTSARRALEVAATGRVTP